MSFAKFSRTPFFKEHLWCLLLNKLRILLPKNIKIGKIFKGDCDSKTFGFFVIYIWEILLLLSLADFRQLCNDSKRHVIYKLHIIHTTDALYL